jgi:hypothetical protein
MKAGQPRKSSLGSFVRLLALEEAVLELGGEGDLPLVVGGQPKTNVLRKR